ncbi:MAG: response regulator transcription factor [Candidatus Flemingiibacterium sp.]
MYKALVVEDDRKIAGAVIALLGSWGIEARGVEDFGNVLGEFAAFSPHIVLLDVSLPFFNGYHWCGEIRKVSQVPIMFISSASDNLNIIMAMNMGADDFIAKPFDGDLLVAKIQALLRRAYAFSESAQVLEHRGALLNTGDGTLTVGGSTLELTKNEYRILLLLMKNRGRVVSREKLMEQLWQTDDFVDENTLTVNVNRLRKKLSAVGLEGFITTRFGVGYIIE